MSLSRNALAPSGFLVNADLFFHFGFTFFFAQSLISDSRHYSRNAVILLCCRLISGSHRWCWSGSHTRVWWCTGCSLLLLARAECSAAAILGRFLLGRPTVWTGGPTVVVGRSQWRSADSLDSARRLLHAIQPPLRHRFGPLMVPGDWVIWLVTGRYLALHQPRSKSSTARTAVSAPVHGPLCSGVITGGLLMGGLSSPSQGSISFLAGLILIRVSDRRRTTEQVCS